RSWGGSTATGERSTTIVRTGGTAGFAAGLSSRPSVAKLQGSRTISSGLIAHYLHRLDFGHRITETSGFLPLLRILGRHRYTTPPAAASPIEFAWDRPIRSTITFRPSTNTSSTNAAAYAFCSAAPSPAGELSYT